MLLYFPMALTHGPLVHTPLKEDARSKRQRHVAMVEYTDHLVGRLLGAIEDLKLGDDTIVIFTTDNGTSRGLLGRRSGARPSGGKGSKWEGGVCQPFLVYGPGRVPAGTTRDALVDFTDLLPTFAELGGAALPADSAIDGRSFAKVLLGQAEQGPRSWIMSLGHGPARLDELGVVGQVPYTPRVVRGERFKIWVNKSREITALYDLEEDPLERANLLGAGRKDANAALRKLQLVVKATPARDARPQYRARAPRPWDRKRKK